MREIKNPEQAPIIGVLIRLLIIVPVLLGTQLLFASFMNPYIQKIVIDSGIAIILAVSLNLVNGFTGQFSIGHAGFMAVGAYTTAFLVMNYSGGMPQDLAFFVYTLAGGLAAAVAGWAVGLPSLKLKGDYLAIVTLGFGEIIRVVLLNMESVGGARGMYGIPKISDFVWVYGWAIVTVLVVWRLIRSSHGRAFMAVREDEIAAEAMGINTTLYKTRAFVIAAFFAGVGGALFAHYLAYLNPSTFGFMKSIDFVVMVVLGGMGSISGSVLAAMIITVLPEALRPVKDLTGVDFRMVIYSLLLVVGMIVRPQGLFGRYEIQDIARWFQKRLLGREGA